MRLGAFISDLEKMPQNESVMFDFPNSLPVGIEPFRGRLDDDDLAIGYYSEERRKRPTAASLLEACRAAVGARMIEWKGGIRIGGEHSMLWVGESYDLGRTAVVGVRLGTYGVVIETGWYDEKDENEAP